MLKLARKHFEPEHAQLRQDLPLLGDSIGHDNVKCADAIRRDGQQVLAQVIDITDLSMVDGEGQVWPQKRLMHGRDFTSVERVRPSAKMPPRAARHFLCRLRSRSIARE